MMAPNAEGVKRYFEIDATQNDIINVNYLDKFVKLVISQRLRARRAAVRLCRPPLDTPAGRLKELYELVNTGAAHGGDRKSSRNNCDLNADRYTLAAA
jgi:CO dehydrogenase/acetyl-CoA synthase alpha subunit